MQDAKCKMWSANHHLRPKVHRGVKGLVGEKILTSFYGVVRHSRVDYEASGCF